MIKKRVNGKFLSSNIGQTVILLGVITKKSPNGKSIEITTTDNASVNVTLPEPLDGNAEGYIELHGTLQSKSTMSCNFYVTFPSAMTEKFDANQYNEMLSVLNVIGPKRWRTSEQDSGMGYGY